MSSIIVIKMPGSSTNGESAVSVLELGSRPVFFTKRKKHSSQVGCFFLFVPVHLLSHSLFQGFFLSVSVRIECGIVIRSFNLAPTLRKD